MAQKKSLTREEYFNKIGKEDKATIVNLQKRKPLDFIPTGSWVLDQIIGDGTMTGKPGGFPRGHIVEIFGDESSGKTTLALSGIKKAQELGGIGILLDFEQTFHADYAEKIGVNLSPNKFILSQPNHFQQGIRQIRDMLFMKPLIIVVDSVSAMLPKEFLEGDVDDAQRIGLQAQLMAAFLSYITKGFLKNSNTSLIFTNQMRAVIKKSKFVGGPDEESSGGRALKFYSSVRLKLKKSTVENVDVKSRITGKKGKEPINVTIKASVVKNKIDRPYRVAPVFIRFGEGFDNIRSIILLALNTKVITKSGNFYYFKQGGKLLLKAQGKEQLWQTLNDNEKIFDKLQGLLTFKEDEKIKEIYQEQDDDEPVDEMDEMMTNIADNFIKKEKEKKEKDD